MGKKTIVKCDKGFDIDYEYEPKPTSTGTSPFHFHRAFNGQPVRCPEISRRLIGDEICCELYCCNCDHLNIEPLEE